MVFVFVYFQEVPQFDHVCRHVHAGDQHELKENERLCAIQEQLGCLLQHVQENQEFYHEFLYLLFYLLLMPTGCYDKTNKGLDKSHILP